MTASELERWRAAQEIIDKHGDMADLEAAQRADRAIADGDARGESQWMDVLKKIRALQGPGPVN